MSLASAGYERRLGPLRVTSSSADAAIGEVIGAIRERRPLRMAFANTHLLYCAVRDRELARQLGAFYVVNDGVGIDLFARMATGRRFPENLNGTDLVPRILTAAPPQTRVFLLGAAPQVAAVAAQRLRQRWPHLNICGVRDGYCDRSEARAEIAAAAPELVLVAMGNPLQERLIAECSGQCGVFIGVGALFDFLAGAVPRAPAAWRRLRLEWLFRLSREPARLWRRYTIEIAILFLLFCRERLTRRA